jgi:hypothetical protein
MALTEMMEMKETMGGQGMPQSLDTMAAVRGGGMPPQPQGMMPSAPSPAMAQGTGMPLAMPQPAPAMAAPAMPPSGLAGIAPPATAISPPMGEVPESNMVLAALETLNRRGQKKTIYEGFRESARDRGVNLPNAFLPETGGLMRLAAEGGPVLYRREGGIPKDTQPQRDAILAQMKRLSENYGALVQKMGEPIDLVSNNPLIYGGGRVVMEDFDSPSKVRYTEPAFYRQYQALAGQLQDLNKQPEEPVSSVFTPLSDMRYGSLNDPNLPAMDAAQQRLQYRQNVGFYEKPPGPTANTRRILSQAYGEGTPIYEEILQGLQPTPTQPVSAETAMEAFLGLPGTKYDPEKGVEVEAQTGGGLQDLKIAAGGEFSGRVPGDGGGMQDNVRMPIMEGEEQVATLAVSPTEYVVDSYTMAALGNGNPDKGADYMDEVVEDIREEAYGTTEQPNEIDGLALLQANMMG